MKKTPQTSIFDIWWRESEPLREYKRELARRERRIAIMKKHFEHMGYPYTPEPLPEPPRPVWTGL